ncbi:Hypothetical protein CINCED_3A025232 [Cinara cedri]|uniref:Uncharacterized protein n=1 Tax=Cinara cedri TaxID=506608 RepID=A0A5E4M2H0_9HEMI|nr:Hypothetical protein CINCED_3A025232 [Cinara cedri]
MIVTSLPGVTWITCTYCLCFVIINNYHQIQSHAVEIKTDIKKENSEKEPNFWKEWNVYIEKVQKNKGAVTNEQSSKPVSLLTGNPPVNNNTNGDNGKDRFNCKTVTLLCLNPSQCYEQYGNPVSLLTGSPPVNNNTNADDDDVESQWSSYHKKIENNNGTATIEESTAVLPAKVIISPASPVILTNNNNVDKGKMEVANITSINDNTITDVVKNYLEEYFGKIVKKSDKIEISVLLPLIKNQGNDDENHYTIQIEVHSSKSAKKDIVQVSTNTFITQNDPKENQTTESTASSIINNFRIKDNTIVSTASPIVNNYRKKDETSVTTTSRTTNYSKAKDNTIVSTASPIVNNNKKKDETRVTTTSRTTNYSKAKECYCYNQYGQLCHCNHILQPVPIERWPGHGWPHVQPCVMENQHSAERRHIAKQQLVTERLVKAKETWHTTQRSTAMSYQQFHWMYPLKQK